jgi:formylglycine-generating enzyme required for sulfatase activity
MSDFLKKFLLEEARRLNPSGRFVGLAAFGKHPGWDDHIEDLGLETEALNFAKLLLYVNGIGGQIDSGAWEKLEATQQLPGFQHVFVWQRSGQILVGRMWSSSDGKGRKRYPMVVCLHIAGVPLGWALKQGLPVLAKLEEGCLTTTSAEEVRSLLARKRAALREAVQLADGRGEYAPVSPDVLNKILGAADQASREGYLRVLYQVQSQLSGFAPGVFNVNSARVQQIRVPVNRASLNPEQALLFWTRFFLVFVDQSVPLLFTLPLEADWMDVTVGEPESHELFCLRATPKAVPLVSEVPYKLEGDFRAKATAFLDGFQRGETVGIPDWKPAATPLADAPQPSRGGLLKWLGIGLILIVGGVAAFLFIPKSATHGPLVSSPVSNPEALQAFTNSEEPAASNAARLDAAKQQSEQEAQAEANRLAEEKKKSDAVAAAARLKAETEAAAKEKERLEAEATAKEQERLRAEAAAKEKKEQERQLAEAAAKEKERQGLEAAREAAEKQAADQKELQEQQRKAAELASLKPTPADQVVAKSEPAVVPSSSQPLKSPVITGVVSNGAVSSNQMTNSIGMVLVIVPSGLWVGKYEVTQGEYNQVMKSNPSNPKWRSDRQPVEQVTWNDAVEFTRKLNELERSSLPMGKVYSLPTEKQWKEFAADQKFEDLPGGTAIRKDPSAVGASGPPNRLGLFDVLGNLWEWCLDDAPGDQKLLKGGAFNSNNYDRTLRSDAKSLSCGFRCVLGPADNH